MTTITKINATSSAYDGADFPEAARYPEYVADRLRADYPGAEVEVSEGPDTRVFVYGANGRPSDDHDLAREIVTAVGVTYWDDFCSHDYAGAKTP